MKPTELKYKRINIKLYRSHIILFEYTANNCAALKTTYEENIGGYTAELNTGGVCIGLKEKSTLSEIAHECLHAANRILHRAGCKHIALDDDETQTYLLTYIMENVLKYKDSLLIKKD